MKKIAIIIILACIAVSCQSVATIKEDVTIVSIGNDAVTVAYAKDIFQQVDYISPLFDENHPIGLANKVLVKDGTIFISDGRTLFQYSANGEYIRSLERRGRGPQEYYGIMDFALDNDNIYIIDRNTKLLKYTVNNDFVAAEKLDFFPASIYITDNGKLLLTSAYQNEGDKFNVYNTESLQREGSFHPITKAEMSYRHIMGQSNFYTYDDRLLYHEPMNNSVYNLDVANGLYTELYRFDLDGHNPPADFWEQQYSNVAEINIAAIEKDYNFGLPVFAITDNYMLFTYRAGANYRMCLYNRRDGSSRSFEALQFAHNMPAVSIADISFCFSNEESLYMVIPENFFFDDNGHVYANGVLPEGAVEGNPVIISCNLNLGGDTEGEITNIQ